MRELKLLLKREFILGFRNSNVTASIFVYLGAVVMAVYLAFPEGMPADTYLPMLWIIILFSSFQAASASFHKENRYRKIYLYLLAHPRMVIISKILSGFVQISVISFAALAFFILLFGPPDIPAYYFCVRLLLSSFGFSCVLMMITAIASNTRHAFSITAVLGLPLMLPLLLLTLQDSASGSLLRDLLLLLLTDLIVFLLACILYPYLWRD